MTDDEANRIDRAELHGWIERYEQLWRTAGTDSLGDLIASDASYSVSPWAEPIRGLDAIGRMWEDERDGPDEGFTMTSDVVAVDGDLGVARIQVDYANGTRWRDLWLIRLGPSGRCVAFEESPIAPDE